MSIFRQIRDGDFQHPKQRLPEIQNNTLPIKNWYFFWVFSRKIRIAKNLMWENWIFLYWIWIIWTNIIYLGKNSDFLGTFFDCIIFFNWIVMGMGQIFETLYMIRSFKNSLTFPYPWQFKEKILYLSKNIPK
jgi:hypothetical protein